jgi:VIT1/CCC1 family predicted Fe2+/Mn2+ transporter
MPAPSARNAIRTYLKQIVYGGNDGIVTTFAVVAGFAGAQAQGAATVGALAVLVFGMANLAADGVSMGLGEFLSGRSSRDIFRARHAEAEALAAADPQFAAERLAEHLAGQGLAPEAARHAADHLAESPCLMADLSLRYDHGMESPDAHNPAARAWMTFASFVAFGIIPLLPYLAAPVGNASFAVSLIATAAALVLLGLLRWSVSSQSLWRSVGETLGIGGLAAAVAYGAGLMVAGLA